MPCSTTPQAHRAAEYPLQHLPTRFADFVVEFQHSATRSAADGELWVRPLAARPNIVATEMKDPAENPWPVAATFEGNVGRPINRSSTTGPVTVKQDSRAQIRLLIADDHALILEGLAATIGRQDDMTVVAKAHNGQDALEL